MKISSIIVAPIAMLVGWANPASSQPSIPLNTGYNHATSSVYAAATRDNYWINLATSTPTNPATDLTWNIATTGTPWQPPLPAITGVPGTSWISAWNSPPSHLDPVTRVGYTIFRKCFCLMPFSQARIAFDVRGDDNITIWLNTTLNNLLPATSGRWNLSPIQVATADQSKFRIGVNCLYVLLEDTGGHMGLNLRGTVRAFGLMPMPAAGTATSFAPCGCDTTGYLPTGPIPATKSLAAARTAESDDRQVLQAIVKIAEARVAKRKPATKN